MEEHTSALAEVARALREVSADTKALPVLREDMAKVAVATTPFAQTAAVGAKRNSACPTAAALQRVTS